MQTIDSNNKIHEQSIYNSLITIADILADGDGHRTVDGLMALINECRGYVYKEADRAKKLEEKLVRYKNMNEKERTMLIFFTSTGIILGIMIGKMFL